MAENTGYIPLPADLPENWTPGQTIAPAGADVGLSEQHGYNYLNAQVNAAQRAANQLNEEKAPQAAALPPGGTPGQLLGKTGEEDYQTGWQDAVGRSMAGQTVEPTKGTTVTAGEGAEVFNDYRNRTFVDSGTNPMTGNVASGTYSHAEGTQTTATGSFSHAEGRQSAAFGQESHTEGVQTTATGQASHAEGVLTIAAARAQHVGGAYNIESANVSDKFIIGKGTSTISRANCLRVTDTGVYASGNYNSSGADYAELFEWADGNPDKADRCGRFVTLDGEKIRIAAPDDDYILGIVSGNPSVVGDVHDDQWQGMYLYDVFGRPLWEDVEVPDEIRDMPDPEDPEHMIPTVIIPAHTEHRQKLNPAYDNAQTYLPRSQRPEWDAVGMVGKLVAVDDGTCQVNGWCTVGEGGVATRSETRTKYRVMARLDETHVRVLIL